MWRPHETPSRQRCVRHEPFGAGTTNFRRPETALADLVSRQSDLSRMVSSHPHLCQGHISEKPLAVFIDLSPSNHVEMIPAPTPVAYRKAERFGTRRDPSDPRATLETHRIRPEHKRLAFLRPDHKNRRPRHRFRHAGPWLHFRRCRHAPRRQHRHAWVAVRRHLVESRGFDARSIDACGRRGLVAADARETPSSSPPGRTPRHRRRNHQNRPNRLRQTVLRHYARTVQGRRKLLAARRSIPASHRHAHRERNRCTLSLRIRRMLPTLNRHPVHHRRRPPRPRMGRDLEAETDSRRL